MALYLLEYDLRKQRDYQKLYAELEKFSAKRVLESLWCFNRNNTSTESLRNHFTQFIDNDDGLIVLQATEWASRHTLSTPNQL